MRSKFNIFCMPFIVCFCLLGTLGLKLIACFGKLILFVLYTQWKSQHPILVSFYANRNVHNSLWPGDGNVCRIWDPPTPSLHNRRYHNAGPSLIHADLHTPSQWLQMSWGKTCTRQSAIVQMVIAVLYEHIIYIYGVKAINYHYVCTTPNSDGRRATFNDIYILIQTLSQV